MRKLIEEIPYRKTIWIFGFIKTTLSSALISTGVVLIFNGITNHPLFHTWNEIAIVVGFLAIISAITIITSIDKWKEKQKREELETIDKKIVEERELMKNEFHEEAVKIAHELIDKELKNIEEEI